MVNKMLLLNNNKKKKKKKEEAKRLAIQAAAEHKSAPVGRTKWIKALASSPAP